VDIDHAQLMILAGMASYLEPALRLSEGGASSFCHHRRSRRHPSFRNPAQMGANVQD